VRETGRHVIRGMCSTEPMLEHYPYEKYLEQVGGLKVDVPTLKAGPISGRREILYARQYGC
jgi:hypothetical protein